MEKAIIPAWVDNPTEPAPYEIYLFQDSFDDDTPEAVAFRETIRNAELRCATCALNGKEGCKAFKCSDGEIKLFAEALSFDGSTYRFSEGGDEYDADPESEAVAAWRGFLRSTLNAASRDEAQGILDAYVGWNDDQLDVRWAQIEHRLFFNTESRAVATGDASTPWEAALQKLVSEAEELDRTGEIHSNAAKEAKKGAAKIRAKIDEIIAQGSANFQPSEPLFDWSEQQNERAN